MTFSIPISDLNSSNLVGWAGCGGGGGISFWLKVGCVGDGGLSSDEDSLLSWLFGDSPSVDYRYFMFICVCLVCSWGKYTMCMLRWIEIKMGAMALTLNVVNMEWGRNKIRLPILVTSGNGIDLRIENTDDTIFNFEIR